MCNGICIRAGNICDGRQGGRCIGRGACARDACMCMSVRRACVCCVGGLIMESHEQPGSSLEGGGRGEGYMLDYGWGGAVSSSAPTSSFTFFCTRVGGRVCLRV